MSDTGFDVVVVGLGAVGSATAWQAAKRGARVLGIDRFAPPHPHGSSHGDTRITRQAIGEGAAYVPLALRSCELFREAEAATGESLLTVTGGLWISSARRQAETHVAHFFDNTVAAARQFGIAHEILDAAAIRARFPQFAARPDEVGYHEPGAGYLRPEACVRAQLRLAAAHGAQLLTGERVTGIAAGGVTTDRGSYRAREVVVCAGAWVARFLPPALAGRLTLTRQVQHWFAVDGPIERFTAPAFPVFIWELQERRHVIYGFPAVDGAGGGVKVATEQYARTLAPPGDGTLALAPASHGEIAAMHAELVAPYLPEVSARSLKAVPCVYTATPDFHFLVDRHPDLRGVLVASPCSGHGFKHSAALGEALAQWALEGRPQLDLAPFGRARLAA